MVVVEFTRLFDEKKRLSTVMSLCSPSNYYLGVFDCLSYRSEKKMLRLSSLCSLWTATRSGLIVSLLVCVASYCSCIFAHAAEDVKDLGAMNVGDPSMQDSSLSIGQVVNIGSGIKRSENSLGHIRAFLYGDVAVVCRCNLQKIDYENLSSFVDEIVDQAGGSVHSEDSYRSELREFQKKSAKSSFRSFASTFQNFVVQKLFQNKVDEIYFISYKDDSSRGCDILAVPIDGLNAGEQNTALNALNDYFAPITSFIRFGFIVIVIDHDKAIDPDLDSLRSRYEEQLANSTEKPGAYLPSSGEFGRYGVGSGTDSTKDSSDISALDQYQIGVKKAIKTARDDSRHVVLPDVRRRFTQPATEDESKPFFDALRQGDSTCLTFVSNSLSSFIDLFAPRNKVEDEMNWVSQPFGALGAFGQETEVAPKTSASDSFTEAVRDLDKIGSYRTLTIVVSLVGSPRVAGFVSFESADVADNFSNALKALFVLAKTSLQESLNRKIEESSLESADLTPLLDAFFNAAAPQVNNTKVATVFDFDIIKSNAPLFLPLLGGTETKSAQEIESESIDWGDSGKTENDSPKTKKEENTGADILTDENLDEDDLFTDSDDSKVSPSDSGDDPFADSIDSTETSEEDDFGSDPF